MAKEMLRNRLFQEGADAANATLGLADTYVCPLCGSPHTFDSVASRDLTLEHVPPESMGGREIILTCKPCNNRAGGSIEGALHDRSKVRNFMSVLGGETHGFAGQVTIHYQDHYVTADASRELSGDILFRVVQDQTPQQAQQVMQHHLTGEPEDLTEFQVKSRCRFHEKLAKIGDLKSAFLACAAAFGYRFALARPLIDVRRQIIFPNEKILDVVKVQFDSPLPPPRIYLLEDNAGFFVDLGQDKVWLPLSSSGSTPVLPDSTKLRLKETARFEGAMWPKRFEAQLDHKLKGTNTLRLKKWSPEDSPEG